MKKIKTSRTVKIQCRKWKPKNKSEGNERELYFLTLPKKLYEQLNKTQGWEANETEFTVRFGFSDTGELSILYTPTEN
jgi:hypothetical protein